MEAFDRFTCTVQVKESLLLAEDLLEEELEKCLQQWEVGHDDDWDVEDEDDEDDEDASDWEELITDWVRVLLKDVLATATMRIDVKMIENADEDEYENEDHDHFHIDTHRCSSQHIFKEHANPVGDQFFPVACVLVIFIIFILDIPIIIMTHLPLLEALLKLFLQQIFRKQQTFFHLHRTCESVKGFHGGSLL